MSAGAWREPTPGHSLERDDAPQARSIPLPPCAGQTYCSPPGTMGALGLPSSQDGRGVGMQHRESCCRARTAGILQLGCGYCQGPPHGLVVPAWHRRGHCHLQGPAAAGSGRGGGGGRQTWWPRATLTRRLLPGKVATPSFHSSTRTVLQVCTPLIWGMTVAVMGSLPAPLSGLSAPVLLCGSRGNR